MDAFLAGLGGESWLVNLQGKLVLMVPEWPKVSVASNISKGSLLEHHKR